MSNVLRLRSKPFLVVLLMIVGMTFSVSAAVPLAGDLIALTAANDKYVNANNGNDLGDGTISYTDLSLLGNYNAPGDDYAKFLIEAAGGGLIALKCLGSDKYLSVDSLTLNITADADNVGLWEKWTMEESTTVPGKIGFLSAGSDQYMNARSDGDSYFKADRVPMGNRGSFGWEVLDAPPGPPYDLVGEIAANLTPENIGNATSFNLINRDHMWYGNLHYAEYYTASAAMRFARVTENEALFDGVFDRYYSPTRTWVDGVTIPTSLMEEDTHFMYTEDGDGDRIDPRRVTKHRTPFILLETYRMTGDTTYVYKALERSQETRERMAEYYPDAYPNVYDADSMFQNPVVEAMFYQLPLTDAAEKANCVNRSVTWINAHIDALQRDDGLFQHNALQGGTNIWGRGAGWCHMALVDGLLITPEAHPSRERIYRSYLKFMDAMLHHQQPDGMWYQLIDLVDHNDNWKESSATAMICHSFLKGIKQGWLDANVYGPAITKGWQALAARVDENGYLDDVCRGMNEERAVNEGIPYYLDTNKNVPGDFHGQAMLLWLAGELIDTRYSAWALEHGLFGDDALMAGNADGDAQDNFLEYALGGDPTNATVQGSQPTFVQRGSGESGFIEYVYPRRTDLDSGLSYHVQLSDDLSSGSWTNSGSIEMVGSGVLNGSVESVTNRIYADNPQQFIRLMIERE